ncbi:hypothetical protein Y032_0218g2416 [Ancylostoma ceylanicum]|uniref:Uncharacterized protein n=1 Tax=Ancylostoma ceylanicum TaxID=53326 RepID=A0A016SIR8_9BILA|nr:hypothetical protein Y032_0218g2416 [Ancylostoma ceylanicum]
MTSSSSDGARTSPSSKTHSLDKSIERIPPDYHAVVCGGITLMGSATNEKLDWFPPDLIFYRLNSEAPVRVGRQLPTTPTVRSWIECSSKGNR